MITLTPGMGALSSALMTVPVILRSCAKAGMQVITARKAMQRMNFTKLFNRVSKGFIFINFEFRFKIPEQRIVIGLLK
jgi:hypothetical protein